MATVVCQLMLRNDVASSWTSIDPTLALGELGYESDTKKFKWGDGSTAWTSLAYELDVSGTSVNNQIAVWTGDAIIEGTTSFTFDGTDLVIGALGAAVREVGQSTWEFRGAGVTTNFDLRFRDSFDTICGHVLAESTGTGQIGFVDAGNHLSYVAKNDGDHVWYTHDATVRMTLSNAGVLTATKGIFSGGLLLGNTSHIDFGDTSTYISGTSTDTLWFFTGNGERLKIDGNGLTVTGDIIAATDVGAATGTFTGEVTGAGFTGTLDGVLGGGTPAAATVTTLVSTPVTLANDATPPVNLGRVFLTGGTTTITDFDSGVTGQEIIIMSEHAITITDGTNIFLNGSADFVMAATDSLHLIQKADGFWYEIARSVN